MYLFRKCICHLIKTHADPSSLSRCLCASGDVARVTIVPHTSPHSPSPHTFSQLLTPHSGPRAVSFRAYATFFFLSDCLTRSPLGMTPPSHPWDVLFAGRVEILLMGRALCALTATPLPPGCFNLSDRQTSPSGCLSGNMLQEGSSVTSPANFLAGIILSMPSVSRKIGLIVCACVCECKRGGVGSPCPRTENKGEEEGQAICRQRRCGPQCRESCL